MDNKQSKVLITGASGFLGKEICETLSKNNTIWTIGRTLTPYNHIKGDLKKDKISLPELIFDTIIHLAGKAHSYPRTNEETQEFYTVNFHGTVNLLNSLEHQKEIKKFIFASTVAVYGTESGENIDENFPPHPNTPYGISKLNAENYIIEWCSKKRIEHLILRLPLIVGENPPGNLGAMQKAISKGYYVSIKDNQAKKSVVLASDIAKLIETDNWESGIYNLTDGYNPTFREIEKAYEIALKKKIRINISISTLKVIGIIGDKFQKIGVKFPFNSITLKKMTSSLTFNDNKAREKLSWKPNSVLEYLANN